MTATRPPMLAADHIRELTQPFATREAVTQPTHKDGKWSDTTRIHTVHHPSLLTQLRGATSGATGLSDSDASRSIATSKPAAHLEALDTLARIDDQSTRLADSLDIPTTRNLENRLLAISGKIGSEIHPRVRSWWAAARLVTHWDTPALRPHGVPCIECWELNTLRIRVEDEIAACTGCGLVWDRTGDEGHHSLDLLGAHVKWCTDHEITKARHWLIDAAGYPIECTECLPFRDAYTDWKNTHREQVDKMHNAV